MADLYSNLAETDWLTSFDLTGRVDTPDLYLAKQRDRTWGVPHGAAMRLAFDIGVSAFLCVQSVPTIAFLVSPNLDRTHIDRVHKVLWNQGLASLLVVLLGNRREVRVYSLWQTPVPERVPLPDTEDYRLVRTFDLLTQAAEVIRLVEQVESGFLLEHEREKFNQESRIDATLVRNLKETERRLTDQELSGEAARCLILQTIFTAYLEDRRIIDAAYFARSVDVSVPSLEALLEQRDVTLFQRLFAQLRENFNGDIFHAPCAFDPSQPAVALNNAHLGVLAEFRSGLVDMPARQLRFWPYDFAYIPVELISAIYDQFLNENNSDRRASGAYYTPRFLADLVVDQLWERLGDRREAQDMTVLDPACGSGIFLVRVFVKMVEHWRKRNDGQSPPWFLLKQMVERLYGWDKQASAVRIASFSLYVALLEQVEPPAILALIEEGKLLPPLFGNTLRVCDFFTSAAPELAFDLVVGNPPWVSRREEATKSAARWCEEHQRTMPGHELAWAFVWKSAQHLKPEGHAGLLLPAMSFLLNHSNQTERARREWLQEFRLLRVINFADVCFQLFDGADRPTAFALYRSNVPCGADYEFEYWCPKANLLLSTTRMLTIASIDQSVVRASTAAHEPFFWKRRMWANGRDLRLLDWLLDLPKLGRMLNMYCDVGDSDLDWVIGQGFQPLHTDRPRGLSHGFTTEPLLTAIPFLHASKFRAWVIPQSSYTSWPTADVRRAGFRQGFLGPHVLIPQGIIRREGLLRAAYVPESASFQASLQAIHFPTAEEHRAKLLTAILNSKLAAWFYFHTSANFGADRAKVHQEQLLELPFPEPEDLPDPQTARDAARQLVDLLDELLARRGELLEGSNWLDAPVHQANKLVYKYFGLTDDEITLIEDGVSKTIPSMQPRRDARPPLLQRSTEKDQTRYKKALVAVLERWLVDSVVSARILDGDSEWSLVELHLDPSPGEIDVKTHSIEARGALARVMSKLPRRASRNIQLQPDLKVFLDDVLYVVKPADLRYWLQSMALNDADEIAGDLLQQKEQGARFVGNEHRW